MNLDSNVDISYDVNEPITNKDPWKLKLDILEFAYRNSLMIHPDKDLDSFCERTVKCGHCICKDKELCCPCSDAFESCFSKGYCTCRLFIQPELYLKALASARERWLRRKQNG